MELYKAYPHKEKFFDSSLSREMGTIESLSALPLSGNRSLTENQKKKFAPAEEPGLSNYKKMREKYLLYK